MHWAPVNVDPLLALRGALCSERWDEAWVELSLQHRTRSRPVPIVTPAPASVPTPVDPLPSLPPPPPKPPRAKTIVNGKPTNDHPWNQGRPALTNALQPLTTKI